MTTAVITLPVMQKIAAQLNGTYINVDGAAGNQCWDSAARVSQLLGLPIINTWNTSERKGRWPGWAGNMWDCFPQTAEIAAAYRKVGADQPALPGDKAIWGDSDPYYPATHVADVIQDAGALLLCISQNSSAGRPDLPGYSNESAGPTIIQHLPKRGLLGYLRPTVGGGINYQGTNVTPLEDILDMADRSELDRLLKAADRINGVITEPTAKVLTVNDIPKIAAASADTTINAKIRRQGKGAALGEFTSIGAVIAWDDHATLEILASVAASAANDGGTVEQIKETVIDAIRNNTVKVDVTVQGATQ
ncbi:hypothetical protein HWD94_03940 [Pseudarthrobacter equi]|uniref:hypothetical protein n=1 Tax=Pseudarthrobacter equi TaxID=728066 RepID=UPI0021BEFFB9|nr:hypothetical protein [Pseudarthrobacter equi]MCT9624274.1 hypothetical protein [Pseudarthrobacter equi]